MPLEKKPTLRFRTTDLQFHCMKLGIKMPFTGEEEKTKWTEILHINHKSQNFLFWILWNNSHLSCDVCHIGFDLHLQMSKCHRWAQWYNTPKSFQLNITLKIQTDSVLSLLQKVKILKVETDDWFDWVLFLIIRLLMDW